MAPPRTRSSRSRSAPKPAAKPKPKKPGEGAIPKRIGNAEARLKRLEDAFVKHLGVDLDQVALDEQAVRDAFAEAHPDHSEETAPDEAGS